MKQVTFLSLLTLVWEKIFFADFRYGASKWRTPQNFNHQLEGFSLFFLPLPVKI